MTSASSSPTGKKPTRVVVVEGKDDAAALRAYLRAEAPAGKVSAAAEFGAAARGEFAYEFEEARLAVVVARYGKSTLAERVLDAVDKSATEHPRLIAVCFDPDTDPEEREFKFFERDFKNKVELERLAGGLTREGPGRYSFKKGGREGVVIPAPWRPAAAVSFAGLPDEHCLERVLLGGILNAGQAGLTSWAENSTKELLTLVQRHGWKRAFRLWNAALKPDAEAFVDALFQEHTTQGPCLDALRATKATDALKELTAPLPATPK